MRLLRSVLLVASIAATAALAADPPPIPEEIVRMKVERADFSPSAGALEVVVRLDIAEGWHVNANPASMEMLVPTTLSVEPPTDFSVGEIRYPAGTERVFAFAGGKALAVYEGTVRIVVPVEPGPSFTTEGVSFLSKLRYQACDETRCLKPKTIERSFVVKSPGTDGAAAGATGGEGMLPVGKWLSDHGLLPTLFLVALMGLALNLTPCVYPLISVTLAYFGGQTPQGEAAPRSSPMDRPRTVLLASLYALGIAITFSALGVTAALSGGLFGAILQKPATLGLMAALMVALALSSFGVYTLSPPAWLMQRVGSSTAGAGGALLMGLTMGIVAAPCVGPVIVGLLVTVGAEGDPLLGFVLFFTLAAGLGLPYVALGAAAGSLKRLPRSGEWLMTVERLFGFLLLGLALFFLNPLLPDPAVRWLAAALIAAAGVVLGFLDRPGRAPHGAVIAAKRAAGLVAIGLAAWTTLPSTAASGIAWEPFSTAALESAKASGRPAVVDFRADWCLPCIEMEKTTFAAREVSEAAEEFAMLQADVTTMTSENEALLGRYRVLGVPTTIFFDASGREVRRIVGYVAADEFVKLLQETAGGSGTRTAKR